MNTETAITIQPDMHPAANYKLATDVAGLCKQIVETTAVNIAGKKYVRAEGWQSIATAHGCVAGARDVERVEGGIRAIGEIRKITDGVVIATAEGYLGDDESTWQKRPEYAKRAMAQTRAISRACRSAFAHVVVLMDAGLSTTPAEEVPDGGFDDAAITQRAEARDNASRAVAATTKPKLTFGPKNSPVAQAREVMREGNGESEGGDWRDVVVHFGKNKGMRLADLERHSLSWYQKEWQPRPFNGRISDDDQGLRNALDASMGKTPAPAQATDEGEDSEIPFN